MSQDLSKAMINAYQIFHQTIAAYDASWMKITDPIGNLGAASSYVEATVNGVTTYSAQSSSPTPIDLGSEQSVTAVAAFEEVAKLSLKEIRDTPGILESLFLTFGQAGGRTLSKAFWTGFKNLDSTVHPLNGRAILTEQGGSGTIYCADQFTVTPKNASPVDQGNLDTNGLSASTLKSRLAARDTYVDLSGNTDHGNDDEDEKPWLIVPSALRQTAEDLYERRGEQYDGTGLQSGSFNKRLKGVITIPGAAADVNDWFLAWSKPAIVTNADGSKATVGKATGIRPWLRVAPQVSVAPAPDKNYVYVKGYMEYALHYAVDIDRLIWMNKVA